MPRYGNEVNEYIRDTIRTEYLVEGSPWTLRTLTELINDVAIERGWISRRTRINRSYISKNIHAEDVDPESARMDPKDISAAKSIANNRILVTRPFERVEQDGLHLPIAAMTPHGPSTNIWLVHAIDCGMSLPAGWALCIGAPSARDGLRCSESILFPKAPRFAALGISEMVHIDFYGTPTKIAYDNGAEARNERMHRLVDLGVDVEHLPSRQPQKKPFIESLNGSLKRAIENFPGTTRMDGVDGQRDPIALGDKLMTMEELERRIVLWYYTDWARNALERFRFDEFEILGNLGKTPEKRWARMTGELSFPTPMPPSMTEWRNVLYKHEVRKLNRKTGITYAGFNYRLHNLTYLIQTLGETEVKVLVDPDDYRQVFVDLGDDGPLIPLTEEHVDDTTPAYSLSQAIARRSEQTPDEEDEEKRRQSRLEKHKFVTESRALTRRPRKSKVQRNREVADKTKEDHAIKTASIKPLQTHSPAFDSDLPTEESVSYDAYDDVAPLPVLNRRDGGAR